jgi:hypothetical protein
MAVRNTNMFTVLGRNGGMELWRQKGHWRK